MILSDRNLRELIKSNQLIIEPLDSETVQQNGIDFCMGDELAIVTSTSNTEIINSKSSTDIRKFYQIVKNEEGHFIFSPLRHYLLTTKENIKMPSDLMGFCGLRSTFARLGFVSPLTIIDAGFEGTLTIGVFYGGNKPIRVPVGCRFLHVVFAKRADKVDIPYHGQYKRE
ncbi:MAG: dCTP deaminase, partial [Candidatus Jordarchaeaceae archaeon]